MRKRYRGITGDAARKRNAIRVHEKRMAENEEQRKKRLSAMASRLREKRAAETPEERNRRLSIMAERARHQRAKARKQRDRQLKKMANARIDCCSQDVTSTESRPSRSKKALQLSKKHQKCFDFSQKVTTANCVPVIKTEILDPSEQNQDFILSGYPQHASTIDPKCLVKTAIQNSSKTSQLKLPNIKVEPTEIENVLPKPIKTDKFSENFKNSEIESSPTCNYKLTQCFVLLSVMHLPHS